MSWLEKLSLVIVGQKLDCKYNFGFLGSHFCLSKGIMSPHP